MDIIDIDPLLMLMLLRMYSLLIGYTHSTVIANNYSY